MPTEFRYPTGARPLLIEETARRRRVEAIFVDTLERSGFAEIVLPIIDFAEPYTGVTDPATARQSYRFTDREGELVAIRSDFTPLVARALAPVLTGNLPLQVFYRGDVVRCEESRLGTNRELFQIGAELIGDASEEADLLMLRLAAQLGSSFCDAPLVVHTSPALEPLLRRESRFVLYTHDGEEDAGYYTGLRFWLYGNDRRNPIAQGGRYDTLYGRFGSPAPAIGFTFTIDERMESVPAPFDAREVLTGAAREA
jgi:ATP phosphoribosyltransferase regulatory subunit HisZ